ncbi:MAG: hypothetical protein S4CHLAM102_11490 [Chlamydiia bacterium]|nr:hypothetical protein [Chlamydiia bacterium]
MSLLRVSNQLSFRIPPGEGTHETYSATRWARHHVVLRQWEQLEELYNSPEGRDIDWREEFPVLKLAILVDDARGVDALLGRGHIMKPEYLAYVDSEKMEATLHRRNVFLLPERKAGDSPSSDKFKGYVPLEEPKVQRMSSGAARVTRVVRPLKQGTFRVIRDPSEPPLPSPVEGGALVVKVRPLAVRSIIHQSGSVNSCRKYELDLTGVDNEDLSMSSMGSLPTIEERCAKILWEHQAKKPFPSTGGKKVVFDAIKTGKTYVVQHLIDAKTNFDVEIDSMTPISAAYASGYQDIARLIAHHFPKVATLTEHILDVQTICARFNHKEIIQMGGHQFESNALPSGIVVEQFFSSMARFLSEHVLDYLSPEQKSQLRFDLDRWQSGCLYEDIQALQSDREPEDIEMGCTIASNGHEPVLLVGEDYCSFQSTLTPRFVLQMDERGLNKVEITGPYQSVAPNTLFSRLAVLFIYGATRSLELNESTANRLLTDWAMSDLAAMEKIASERIDQKLAERLTPRFTQMRAGMKLYSFQVAEKPCQKKVRWATNEL